MGKPKQKNGRKLVVEKDNDGEQLETVQQPTKAQGEPKTKCQLDYARACDSVESGELRHFYYLDNKVIEAYYHRDSSHALTDKERMETLDEDAFLFYLRQTIAELQYVVQLPFAKFWA